MAAILILLLFAGCSSMADRLSGSGGTSTSSEISYPAKLANVTIGVTTQQEVRKVFGSPTNLQTSLQNATLRETWAYAQASPSINPLQYLPLLGMFALKPTQTYDGFSISFSSEGIVNGISVHDFQPYGSVTSAADQFNGGSDVTPYGRNNPMIYHLDPAGRGKKG